MLRHSVGADGCVRDIVIQAWDGRGWGEGGHGLANILNLRFAHTMTFGCWLCPMAL